MNWLDLFDDDAEADRAFHREHARRNASEPCEDDYETTSPFVDMLPDESDNRGGEPSPLDFDNNVRRDYSNLWRKNRW